MSAWTAAKSWGAAAIGRASAAACGLIALLKTSASSEPSLPVSSRPLAEYGPQSSLERPPRHGAGEWGMVMAASGTTRGELAGGPARVHNGRHARGHRRGDEGDREAPA